MPLYITSLPHATNDGKPTGALRALFAAQLRADGVSFVAQTPCEGSWNSDDGTLYSETTTLYTMNGSEQAIRNAVGAFGEAAGQLEMLLVEKTDGYLVARIYAATEYDIAFLVRVHGGATLLPNGNAISLRYASMVAGLDYADTNVVR